MAVKTIDGLVGVIDDDLKKRRRELTNARKHVVGERRSHLQAVACRAYVCLAYAHWEGFVKSSVRAYLEYVDSQSLPPEELSVGLTTLAGRRGMQAAVSNNSLIDQLRVARFFIENDDEGGFASPLASSALEGLANLNFRTLNSILKVLDVATADYEAEKAALDEKIVARRHRIAHGGLEPVSPDDLEEVHQLLVRLLDAVRTDIQNLAVTGGHLRHH